MITPTDDLSPRSGERDVGWELTRLWDGGRKLAIFSAFGCNEPGRYLVKETGEAVIVRVLSAPKPSGRLCRSFYRKQIDLAAPLGTRRLLHVVA